MSDLCYVPAGRKAQYGLILLHGLGASSDDLVSPTVAIVSALSDQKSFDIQQAIDVCPFPMTCILPQAPMLPLTIGNGVLVPAWFDIYSLERNSAEDYEGLVNARASVSAISEALENTQGIAPKNIFIGGFSQGGIVALNCLCQEPQRYGGVFALSSCLARGEKIPERAENETSTPVFISHGALDDVIPIQYGHEAYSRLQQAGFRVDWLEQPQVMHTIDDKTIASISQWLKRELTHHS